MEYLYTHAYLTQTPYDMLVNVFLGFLSSIIAIFCMFLYKGHLHLCEKIAVTEKNDKIYYKFKIYNKGLFEIHNIEIDAIVIETDNPKTNGVDIVKGHLSFVNDCVWELPGIIFRGKNYKNAYRFVSNGSLQKRSNSDSSTQDTPSNINQTLDLQKYLSENPYVFLKVRIKYSAPLTGLTKTISKEFSNPFRNGDFITGMNCIISDK